LIFAAATWRRFFIPNVGLQYKCARAGFFNVTRGQSRCPASAVGNCDIAAFLANSIATVAPIRAAAVDPSNLP